MFKSIFRFSIIVVALLGLVSCGGGSSSTGFSGSDTSSTSSSSTSTTSETETSTTDVHNGGDGVVTVSWTIPTQNSDGSTLTDLSGYKIYYGASSTSLNNIVTISNQSITSYVIENLTNGITVYFAVVAYNSKGIESYLSNISSKST